MTAGRPQNTPHSASTGSTWQALPGSSGSGRGGSANGDASRWLVLAIVSVALLLIVIDMTVLYTALPILTHELQASASQKLWIVNMYPLVVAGLLPGAGTLGDRHGHRRVFLAGLLVFGLASLWAAYSPNAPSLIAARAALACGAALMMPATLAIIRHAFVHERERGMAIGIWASVASGGAAVGPLLGGFLLEHFWWGSVFLINVPVVLLSIPLVLALIVPHPGNAARRWDWPSSLLALLGLTAATYAVKAAAQTPAQGQPAWPVVLAIGALGVLLLVVFVRRQRRIAHPLIDLSLLRNRTFCGGVVAAVTCSVALIGFQLVFSQWLQLVRELTPLQAGLQILPLSIAAFLAGPLAGWWMHRVGSRVVIGTGMLGSCAGLVGVVLTHQGLGPALLMALAVFGFGFGMAVTGASSAIMFNAPPEKAGMAASMEEVSYELGGSLGIALLGSLMTASYAAALQLPPSLAELPGIRESIDAARLAAEQLPPELAASLLALAGQAFDHAMAVVTWVTAGLLLLVTALLLSPWGRRGAASD
ncbi:MFS transporter [Corticibacter populi]|uniref:MFS transporter n=1 Tax=Corticibacter populi TaxID=1550736 RepID=A0A3M6QRI5_9BURK|nr:MFS transporter [Corticibacter populi]RMX05654.1 MFS transporter [Corticibacter populi]RZS31067.1 DHA2 family multidrug resistance protein-like MFS transporter [Corticibacter populi]